MKINFGLAAQWISRLSDLDEIMVGNLPHIDFIAAVGKVNEILLSDGVDAKK